QRLVVQIGICHAEEHSKGLCRRETQITLQCEVRKLKAPWMTHASSIRLVIVPVMNYTIPRRRTSRRLFFVFNQVHHGRTSDDRRHSKNPPHSARSTSRHSKHRYYCPRRSWENHVGRCHAPADPRPSENRRHGRAD